MQFCKFLQLHLKHEETIREMTWDVINEATTF